MSTTCRRVHDGELARRVVAGLDGRQVGAHGVNNDDAYVPKISAARTQHSSRFRVHDGFADGLLSEIERRGDACSCSAHDKGSHARAGTATAIDGTAAHNVHPPPQTRR